MIESKNFSRNFKDRWRLRSASLCWLNFIHAMWILCFTSTVALVLKSAGGFFPTYLRVSWRCTTSIISPPTSKKTGPNCTSNPEREPGLTARHRPLSLSLDVSRIPFGRNRKIPAWHDGAPRMGKHSPFIVVWIKVMWLAHCCLFKSGTCHA